MNLYAVIFCDLINSCPSRNTNGIPLIACEHKLSSTSFSGLYSFFLTPQVVDKLQSGNKSKREGWRTQLPAAGLGYRVLELMEEEKRKDVAWQGKCSGTVYVCFIVMHVYMKC